MHLCRGMSETVGEVSPTALVNRCVPLHFERLPNCLPKRVHKFKLSLTVKSIFTDLIGKKWILIVVLSIWREGASAGNSDVNSTRKSWKSNFILVHYFLKTARVRCKGCFSHFIAVESRESPAKKVGSEGREIVLS